MKFSIKVKILAMVISLTAIGLSTFGYISFQAYKQDKLAFVYDHLASNTQSKSQLFGLAQEDNELLLGMAISKIEGKGSGVDQEIGTFLKGDQNKIYGIYLHAPESPTLSEKILFQTDKKGKVFWNWADLKALPTGLSLLGQKGLFAVKKAAGPTSFAVLVFHQPDLWNSLKSSDDLTSFIVDKGKVVSKGKIAFEDADIKRIEERINQNPGASGLFELKIRQENFLVTYSRLTQGGPVLVNSIQERKVLLVQEVFFRQIVLFLVIVVSLSVLIGTLGATWLTSHLDNLTFAAQELEKENFDVKVDIKSRDELETLGKAFNSMSGKIRTLLEELRLHNLELENKVRIRTKELQALTDIQKGMLNALGQGFIIIDKSHTILPIYSKIAEDMFEVVPDASAPPAILGVSEEEGKTYQELFEFVFNQTLGFDELSTLAPKLRSNSKGQRIQLNYAPVINGQEQSFEYILVVGTDKTQEYENMEKFKKEWNFSQMIMKIAGNRNDHVKVLQKSFDMLDECMLLLAKDRCPPGDIQRLIHTIKGNVSYFNMTELSSQCHGLESLMDRYRGEASLSQEARPEVTERIHGIRAAFEEHITSLESIINFKDQLDSKNISLSELQGFSAMLGEEDPSLKRKFDRAFFFTNVSSYFELYPSIVKELSQKLGKDIRFTIEGKDTQIPDGPWDEVFQQFIHFVRNSIDHGIASSGDITFAFGMKVRGGSECLEVVLKDNGQGIDWKKLAKKSPGVTCLADAIEVIRTGGVSSKDEVSEISGRGVGVSALFQAVDKFGGNATMTSAEGQGTSITITLPLPQQGNSLPNMIRKDYGAA